MDLKDCAAAVRIDLAKKGTGYQDDEKSYPDRPSTRKIRVGSTIPIFFGRGFLQSRNRLIAVSAISWLPRQD